MAEISAALVKELRELTGLGMMECKRALAEAGGDLKKAEELLRIRSGAKASKVAGRVAAEGVIGAWLAPDAKLGALVEVNCETDFVAKNEELAAFADSLAEIIATKSPADVAELSAIGDVESRRQGLVQKINENISIRRLARLQGQGRVARYVHHDRRIGSLVAYEGPEDLGKDLAMHVASTRTQYMQLSDVPKDILTREREIAEVRARERAKELQKPPEIEAKIVEGSVNKALAELALLGQPFVKDDKLTIEKLLAAKKAKLSGYRFLVVGEGIEKKSADFTSEVMATASAGR